MKDLDAASEIEILREYAQDDSHFSSIVGAAQSRDDSETVNVCVAQAFSLCSLRPNRRFLGSGATDTG
jgi:hypothetical protein